MASNIAIITIPFTPVVAGELITARNVGQTVNPAFNVAILLCSREKRKFKRLELIV